MVDHTRVERGTITTRREVSFHSPGSCRETVELIEPFHTQVVEPGEPKGKVDRVEDGSRGFGSSIKVMPRTGSIATVGA